MNNSADAAASPLDQVVGLTGIAALEAEMRDRLAAKNTDIERLRAIIDEQQTALIAILEAVRDNDMFRVGQYVTTALAKAKGE